MLNLWHLILIVAALSGFALSLFIRHKKQANQTMVCHLGSDCNAVIYSRYSLFFGVPLELLGLLYYGLIFIGYSLFVFRPELATPLAVFTILGLSLVALLFSCYLTFIQAFALRQWCTWCLTSAGLSIIIFASALAVSDFSFIALLVAHRDFILILHLLGMALGLGGATISDILFMRSLKDASISEGEADSLSALSQIIWFALALLVVSGLGLYLPEMVRLNDTPKFLVKAVAVAVIIINGSLLNLLVAPRLAELSFFTETSKKLRRLAFSLGGISLISWYTTFVLGFLRHSPLTFWPLLLVYFSLLVLAAAGGLLFERLRAKSFA